MSDLKPTRAVITRANLLEACRWLHSHGVHEFIEYNYRDVDGKTEATPDWNSRITTQMIKTGEDSGYANGGPFHFNIELSSAEDSVFFLMRFC